HLPSFPTRRSSDLIGAQPLVGANHAGHGGWERINLGGGHGGKLCELVWVDVGDICPCRAQDFSLGLGDFNDSAVDLRPRLLLGANKVQLRDFYRWGFGEGIEKFWRDSNGVLKFKNSANNTAFVAIRGGQKRATLLRDEPVAVVVGDISCGGLRNFL